MNFTRISACVFALLIAGMTTAESNVSGIDDPIVVLKKIGDKLVRDTPFEYRLNLQSHGPRLDGMKLVDFGRTFGTGKPGVAYAYTHLVAEADREWILQTAHNDACKIWLNGKIVYEKKGRHPLELRFEERGLEMPGQFTVHLRKGVNRLLIKSQTYGDEWLVCLQSPSTKGAVATTKATHPTIGLESVPNVDSTIARLTPWLVIGPFADKQGAGIDTPFPPESELEFGKMYEGATAPVTWTIPKIEILGDMIDPKPWGTNDTWNYHNGGVAWAMQHLGEISGESKYNKYATDYCDFHLNGAPFVNYQVETLRAAESANYGFLFLPLLDYTLAPALPFIHRLQQEQAFTNRASYETYIDRMLKYAKEGQLRYPDSKIFTRLTPEKYTTWVDDMFMGIPFLVQASRYSTSPEEKKLFLDDAADQTVLFNDQVWNPEANLYMHARYSERNVKLPHWSRANGWGIWATSEVLMELPVDHPRYPAILAHYRKHVDSLVALQDKDGFWLQLLDYPDSRQEVSGTAIFTMAIARGITEGWLDSGKYRPYAVKGWDAIKTQIEADGTVHNICYGTMCSEDPNYYLERPFYDNDTHGLFAVLFAGIEMSRLLKFQADK